jgi:hypothetical protein
MEQVSPQDAQQSVVAAFHSVELISNIVTDAEMQDSPIQERVQRVDANVEHLKVMLSKEWFVEALTVQQRSEIDQTIALGTAYISENS